MYIFFYTCVVFFPKLVKADKIFNMYCTSLFFLVLVFVVVNFTYTFWQTRGFQYDRKKSIDGSVQSPTRSHSPPKKRRKEIKRKEKKRKEQSKDRRRRIKIHKSSLKTTSTFFFLRHEESVHKLLNNKGHFFFSLLQLVVFKK